MANYSISLPATGISGGTVGQILYSNSSGTPVYQDYINLSNYAFYNDDFLTPPADLTQGGSGSGFICNVRGGANSAGHPGAARLCPGTTTTGYANLYGSNVDDLIALGGGLTTFESIINISALSDVTNTYTIQIGLVKGAYNNTLVITDGIYFTYTDSVNTGNWTLNCASGSTTTSVDTGSAVTAAWQRLGWVLNAAGTSVQAYLNGSPIGVPITTNIPTANTNFQWYIQKSAGTSQINLDLDAYNLFIVLNTPR